MGATQSALCVLQDDTGCSVGRVKNRLSNWLDVGSRKKEM